MPLPATSAPLLFVAWRHCPRGAMLAAAAVVGPQNDSWFIEAYVPCDDDPLRFHRATFCALDAVPDTAALPPAQQPAAAGVGGYLGVVLSSVEDACSVHGYLSATGVKLMLAAVEGDGELRETDVRAVSLT